MQDSTRRETIDSFRVDMTRLRRSVEGLAQEARETPICGDWTARDVIAHIAAWDRELLRGFESLLAGHRPAFPEYCEPDFNATAVADARCASLAQVLLEAQSAHEALMTRLEMLSDGAWERGSPYRWGDGAIMTAGSLFDYSSEGETHYGAHAKEIESSHAKQG